MPTRKFPSFQVFLNCAGIVYRTYEPKAQVQMEYIVIYAMINHTVYISPPPPTRFNESPPEEGSFVGSPFQAPMVGSPWRPQVIHRVYRYM